MRHDPRGLEIIMVTAREILGPDVPIFGNIDPTILFGTKQQIKEAVRECIDKTGGPAKHLLNLGNGVMQGTPKEAFGRHRKESISVSVVWMP